MPRFSKLVPLVALFLTILILTTIHRWSSLTQAAEIYINQYYSPKDDESLTPEKLSSSVFDSVETMLLFIGYPRSGHTLVASLLDAHPNTIVSNEYNVIKQWPSWPPWKKDKYFLFQQLYNSSYHEVLAGYRAAVNPKGFFGYHVPKQWQGTFDKQLRVIGDKNGGVTTKLLADFGRLPVLEEIKKAVDLPVKFLHVVRNPFDNIATMVLRKLDLRKSITSTDDKVDAEETIRGQTNWYFGLIEMNYQLHEKLGYENVLDIHSEDMTHNPQEVLAKICAFLGLNCSQSYLEGCTKVVHKSTTHTRDYIKWPENLVTKINNEIKRYPFLNGYTFTS